MRTRNRFFNECGDWLAIYAATAGLHGKEAEIAKALNDCTTH